MAMIVPRILFESLVDKSNVVKARRCHLYDHIESTSMSYHKSQNKDKTGDMVNVNKKVFAKRFDCRERTIYDDLIFLKEQGIIKSNGTYQVGKQSKWYQPTEATLRSERIPIDVQVDKSQFIDNLDDAIGQRVVENVRNAKLDSASTLNYLRDKVVRQILKFTYKNKHCCNQIVCQNVSFKGFRQGFNKKLQHKGILCCRLLPYSFHITYLNKNGSFNNHFDDSLNEFVAENRSYLGVLISKEAEKLKSGTESKDYREIFDQKKPASSTWHECASLLYAINSLYKFYFGFFDMSKTKTNNRIRHNIVEMPRELRQFLYIDRDDIVNVDLANSQPAILVGIMLQENVKIEYSLIETVQHGKYYETLADKAGLDIERDELKKRCLHFLYSQASTNEKESSSESITRAFKQLWLEAFNWIVERKQNLNEEYAQSKDKNCQKGSQLFAIHMQKVEASWMIGKVLRRLFNANKNVWAVPMHDGCLIETRYAERLKRVMEEEFKRMFGFIPTVRIKSIRTQKFLTHVA